MSNTANKKNKIAILGGHGFIGSWLVNLLKSDYDVAIFDLKKQLSNYNPSRVRKVLNFRKELSNGSRQYNGDVRDLKQVKEFINKERPQIIVCLSSVPLEGGGVSKSYQLSTEVMGISNILEANETLGARVVYMSSLFAIGHFDHATTESVPLEPRTNYGIGKATGEHLVKSYSNNYAIIRTTSVYGPGDINNRVPQVIIEGAILGNGEKFWINKAALLDFIYVKDLVRGIKDVMFYNGNGVFNISGGRAIPLTDFVNAVEASTGKKLNYEVRSVEDRTRRGTLVNDKARLVLNWEPQFDLMSGVKETISIYKEKIKIKN